MIKPRHARNDGRIIAPVEKTPITPAPTEPAQYPWKPEDVRNFIEMARSLGQEYIDYKNKEFDYKAKRLGSVGTHNRRLTYSLIFFLLAMIGVLSILTWFGRVSGDALLFLAGTITGYVILMVQNLTYPLAEEESSD